MRSSIIATREKNVLINYSFCWELNKTLKQARKFSLFQIFRPRAIFCKLLRKIDQMYQIFFVREWNIFCLHLFTLWWKYCDAHHDFLCVTLRVYDELLALDACAHIWSSPSSPIFNSTCLLEWSNSEYGKLWVRMYSRIIQHLKCVCSICKKREQKFLLAF